MKVMPVTLFGKTVRLEPLAERHTAELTKAGQDDEIWRYMLYGYIRTEEQMHNMILDLLSRQREGTEIYLLRSFTMRQAKRSA